MNEFNNEQFSHNRNRPPKFSSLMSSIIKSKVKKQIYDIRNQKSAAATRLLDELEEKLSNEVESNARRRRHRANVSEQGSATPLDELALKLLKANRKNWCDFLVNLAQNYDATALSCFGTNLIYGGFYTATANNSPRCRFADLSSSATQNDIIGLQNAIRSDLREDRRVCIIRGNNLLSNDLLKLYRFYGDTAFILIDREVSRPTNTSLYNVLYIPEDSNATFNSDPSKLPICGFASLSPSEIDSQAAFRCNASALFDFLSAPALPIRCTVNDFYSAVCQLEGLVSEGKNRSPVIY